EAKIPAHAQDDDLAVKVATLEQLLDAHQLAHADPSGSSADIIAGRILPFAPEPYEVPRGLEFKRKTRWTPPHVCPPGGTVCSWPSQPRLEASPAFWFDKAAAATRYSQIR